MLELSIVDILFLAALLFSLGFYSGVFATLYMTSKHMDKAKVLQKTFAYFFAFIWVLLTIYTTVTSGQPIDWFFNACGFIAFGYAMGINLAEKLPSFKK